ncbi:MAG: hypothetical protein KGZ39_04890 [Simkania sp.]|nr:hypothetical protein [Simkania sp.]
MFIDSPSALHQTHLEHSSISKSNKPFIATFQGWSQFFYPFDFFSAPSELEHIEQNVKNWLEQNDTNDYLQDIFPFETMFSAIDEGQFPNANTLRAWVLKTMSGLQDPNIYAQDSELTQSALNDLIVNIFGLDPSFVASSISTPIPPSKSGYLPIVINNPNPNVKSDDDVYIRIQGIDPVTGTFCYLAFDANGVATYQDATSSTDPAQYCCALSSLPPYGNGRLVYALALISGNILISIDKKLQWQMPDPNNASDPDNTTLWSMVEMTATKDAGIWADYSNVDSVSLPLKLQLHTSNGSNQIRGYNGSRREFIENVSTFLKQYDTTPNQIWSTLAQTDPSGNILRFMSAKHMMPPAGTTFPADYFTNYLSTIFLPYFEQQPLLLEASQADVSKGIETYSGTLTKDQATGTLTFVFKGQTDGNIVTLPVTTTSRPWLTGAIGDWQPTPPQQSTQAYADLIRDLSGIVNAGILPQATQGQLINKSWMINHFGDYYQAPVYNIYDRALHEAGANSYCYDYDDFLGQDGTEVGPFDDGTHLMITLPNLSTN